MSIHMDAFRKYSLPVINPGLAKSLALHAFSLNTTVWLNGWPLYPRPPPPRHVDLVILCPALILSFSLALPTFNLSFTLLSEELSFKILHVSVSKVPVALSCLWQYDDIVLTCVSVKMAQRYTPIYVFHFISGLKEEYVWRVCVLLSSKCAVSIIYRNCPEVGVIVAVQSLGHVQLFATPWTAAHQASLSFTISWSLLKLMSIEVSDAI